MHKDNDLSCLYICYAGKWKYSQQLLFFFMANKFCNCVYICVKSQYYILATDVDNSNGREKKESVVPFELVRLMRVESPS